MTEWLMDGIPRNIADNPDMDVVGRIRDSLRRDNGQTCDSSMLAPCPFCGCDQPYIQTNPLWDCTEEARVVCPSCHVATTRDGQSWRVSYQGDDVTRTLAIGRAISRWNRRAERTCRNLLSGQYDGETFKCSECDYACEVAIPEEPEPYSWLADWHCELPAYCPNCGAKVVES